jgi:hypothetical protein
MCGWVKRQLPECLRRVHCEMPIHYGTDCPTWEAKPDA